MSVGQYNFNSMTGRRFRLLSLAVVISLWPCAPGSAAQIDPRTALLEKAGWDALTAGEAQQAAESFRAALAGDPGNARLHLGAGIAAYLERRDDGARMELERALALDPRLTEARAVLGQVQHRMGDVRGAILTLDLVVANGHIDETVRNIRGHVGYAQPPLLFLNQGNDTFRDSASAAGDAFAAPRVGRGLAVGDFDRDGDLDLLMTTNGGPALLFRNDQLAGNRSLRFRLVGTKSNRDAIGAIVRIFHDGTYQSRMVKTGSSYLSQSELPVTFGVGRRDRVDRVVIAWPSGRVEEFKSVASARAYECVEGRGLTAQK